MREIRSSVSRNESVRSKVEASRKENGFMLGFMAKKTLIPLSTISSWRTGRINFIDDKLDVIESFLKRYK